VSTKAGQLQTFVALLFGLLPLSSGLIPPKAAVRLAAASCTAALLLAAAYVPAILAHYGLIFGRPRKPDEEWRNPEPAEGWIVGIAVVFSVAACAAVIANPADFGPVLTGSEGAVSRCSIFL